MLPYHLYQRYPVACAQVDYRIRCHKIYRLDQHNYARCTLAMIKMGACALVGFALLWCALVYLLIILGSPQMSRMNWIIQVTLDMMGTHVVQYKWCPSDDPVENSMESYTRAGHLLIGMDG